MQDLTDSITSEFPDDADPDPLESQNALHNAYADTKTRCYLWRQDYYNTLCSYLSNSSSTPYVISGPSGIGKSSLLANLGLRLSQEGSDSNLIVTHFIGYLYLLN